MRLPFLLSVLVVLFSLSLVAQVDTGSIAGNVRDGNGAGLPNATVTFTETSTNGSWKTQTDGSGNYVSVPLRPGVYKVTTDAQGFKTQVRDGPQAAKASTPPAEMGDVSATKLGWVERSSAEARESMAATAFLGCLSAFTRSIQPESGSVPSRGRRGSHWQRCSER